MHRNFLFYFFISATSFVCAQSYSIKTFNWKDAGYKGLKPVYTQTANIMNYGGNNTGGAPNNQALNAAITALNGKGGVVYFPKGIYNFTTTVSLNRDSITFKGASADSTQLRFSMNGILNNCFNVWGTQINNDTTSFTSPGIRDSIGVSVLSASPYQAGQWVFLQCNDSIYMASNWAYGSLGQIMQVKSITGNTLTFHSPFRFYYKSALKPKITRINPLKAIGFECLKIQRMDATANQTSLISFDRAVQCWVHGIEGDSTNFAHIELNRCSNIEITNSWFHHAFAYGGSGQGYGIAFQYSAGECRAENNIFQHLRHSMLFQAGANGNVCGYNYSFDPYWNQFPFPTNSSGDIVFHGNFPFANLCEGNINQNTVIDDSHGINGSYNTLFRNRSELYGVVMNNNPASDTIQFLGLEITSPSYGQYLIYGNGHLQYGNKVQGQLTPAGTGGLTENSLYYTSPQKPLCFNPGNNNWPVIGIPNIYNTGSNAAKDRYSMGIKAACVCTSTFTTGQNKTAADNKDILVYPNPATEIVYIEEAENVFQADIYSAEGKLLLTSGGKNIKSIDTNTLTKGIYFLYLRSKTGMRIFKLIKE